jgi:hypothetical protein
MHESSLSVFVPWLSAEERQRIHFIAVEAVQDEPAFWSLCLSSALSHRRPSVDAKHQEGGSYLVFLLS